MVAEKQNVNKPRCGEGTLQKLRRGRGREEKVREVRMAVHKVIILADPPDILSLKFHLQGPRQAVCSKEQLICNTWEHGSWQASMAHVCRVFPWHREGERECAICCWLMSLAKVFVPPDIICRLRCPCSRAPYRVFSWGKVPFLT